MISPLSPAAQAVKDRFLEQGLAAALRAAADRTMSLIGDICHSKYMEGIEAASDFLEHIAAELEGQDHV